MEGRSRHLVARKICGRNRRGGQCLDLPQQRPDQPLRLSLAAAPALATYGDAKNEALLDPAQPLPFLAMGSGPLGKGSSSPPDLSLKLEIASTSTPDGAPACRASLVNTSASMAWACAYLAIKGSGEVKLSSRRALGTWVKGDKSGAVLHFVIEDINAKVRDYFTVLDFDNWRRVVMREPAAGEVFDFDYVYSNYWPLHRINLDHIRRMYVFLTNVPPKAKVECLFGRVEALQEIALDMANPGLSVAGQSITFLTTLQPEDYLEYEGAGAPRVFDKNGNPKAAAKTEGSTPHIKTGDNTITFFCDTSAPPPGKITIMTRGAPLA